MKIILILLSIFTFVLATQWQVPHPCLPAGIAFTGPSFTGDNLRIYSSIYYSIYHGDIAYYDWNGSQWVYIDRVPGDVNTTNDEEEPFITYDGLHLYFMRSTTPGGSYHNICVADWNGSGFYNSRPLNSLINTGDARYPCITQDGQKLYFSRGKIWESTWVASDWGTPVLLPPEVNDGGMYRWYVTISPDGNEIYFTGAPPHALWLAYSKKVGGVWQQWQYCDSNINQEGKTSSDEALTYNPYSTQELYFYRTGEGTLHAQRSPISVQPTSLGAIKAYFR